MFESRTMRGDRLAGLSLLIVVGLCLSGCSRKDAGPISHQDLAAVLTLAADAVAREPSLSSGYCITTALDPAKTIYLDEVEEGAWSDETDGVAYRLIVTPNLGELPDEAVSSFPSSARNSGCDHQLSFHEPQFVEIRKSTGNALVGYVTIDDLCPLCGASYSVTVVKRGDKWHIDPPGVELTTIS